MVGLDRKSMARTGVGVEGSVVQVLDNLLDGGNRSVPARLMAISLTMFLAEAAASRLPLSGRVVQRSSTPPMGQNLHLEVAADEELASHVGQLMVIW